MQGFPLTLMYSTKAVWNMSMSSMCLPGSGTKHLCMSAILQAHSSVKRKLMHVYIIETGIRPVAERIEDANHCNHEVVSAHYVSLTNAGLISSNTMYLSLRPLTVWEALRVLPPLCTSLPHRVHLS